jgi:[acyl-carrier-protein] S-malonyltransferase
MSDPIALVFPGQGSQFVGMGRDLCEAFPHLRVIYEEAEHLLGYSVSSLCFDGPKDKLDLTEFTQPALLVSSMVSYRLLEGEHVKCQAVAGHSLGEYSALVAAGGLTFPDAVGLVQKRGHYMAEAVPPGSGLVAAILGLSTEDVEAACREAQSVGIVSAANFNSPGQIVIAGEKAAVERAIELVKARGCRRAMPLPVSVPVHTSLMQKAADQFSPAVNKVPLKDLSVPLVNNAEARSLQQEKDVRQSLIQQLPSPVLWEQSIRAIWDMGIRVFVEVGPGKVLTGLIKRIVPEAVTHHVSDPSSFEATMTQLSP